MTSMFEHVEAIRILCFVHSNEPPATKAQVRRLNITMSDLLGQNRSGKLTVISYLVGRRITSTKDLNRYEAKILIEEKLISEIVDYAISNTSAN